MSCTVTKGSAEEGLLCLNADLFSLVSQILENCAGFIKWRWESWKTFVDGVTENFCVTVAAAMSCVRQPARARNVEKESVCGCPEWFDFSLVPAHLPDLSPVLQMSRPDCWPSEVIFGCWFSPSPCSERKYWLHVCVFPGAAYLQLVSLNLF